MPGFKAYRRCIGGVLVHKWFVLLAGLRTRAPLWRLVIHDWTKFTPSELPHYARRFYGANDDQLGFAQARNHHFNANPHHWEYWIPVTAHSKSPVKSGEPLPMPEWAVREMVADLLAAVRSYDGYWPKSLDDWQWLKKHRHEMRLHPDSHRLMDQILAELFTS